jgi:CheY-like chemotaxis protein
MRINDLSNPRSNENREMTTTMNKILLVEDDPNDVELMLRALKRHNLTSRVLVLRDGEEALEYLFHKGEFAKCDRPEKPKVVILDLNLPKINGMDVLKKIKSNEGTRDIPVVILSSSQEDSVVTRSYELGVNGYVVKPSNYDEFQDTVSDMGLYWARLNELPQTGRAG